MQKKFRGFTIHDVSLYISIYGRRNDRWFYVDTMEISTKFKSSVMVLNVINNKSHVILFKFFLQGQCYYLNLGVGHGGQAMDQKSGPGEVIHVLVSPICNLRMAGWKSVFKRESNQQNHNTKDFLKTSIIVMMIIINENHLIMQCLLETHQSHSQGWRF